MHPAVLKKVIENDAEHLKFSPAILFVRRCTFVLSTRTYRSTYVVSLETFRTTPDTMLRSAPGIMDLNPFDSGRQDVDYPGVVPYQQSRSFFDHELSRDECCVRGSIVTGLDEKDIRLLDHFEGEVSDVCVYNTNLPMDLTDVRSKESQSSSIDGTGTHFDGHYPSDRTFETVAGSERAV